MALFRRRYRFLALFLLAATLFGQAAQAVEVCLQAPAMAAKAVAAASMPDCHEMSSKAACAVQAKSPDQGLAHATVAVFEAPSVAVLNVPLGLPTPLPAEPVSPTAEPPPAIRFCSLRL